MSSLAAKRICLLALITLLPAGCSNKQLYNAAQENRRQECAKLPQVRYEDCMRDYDTPYEDYERERQGRISDEKKVE